MDGERVAGARGSKIVRAIGREGPLAVAMAAAIAWCAALSTAGADEPSWQELCTVAGENLSLGGAQLAMGPSRTLALETMTAARASVVIERARGRARARVRMTAPFALDAIVGRIDEADLSLRAGTSAAIVTAARAGAVRVIRIGNGNTMDVAAGHLEVRGVPLRCQDLVAGGERHRWGAQASHHVRGLTRLYREPGRGASYSVRPIAREIGVSVERRSGEWVELVHGATGAFGVRGWARAPQLREGLGGGGGAFGQPLVRSCAPGSPARITLSTIAAGATLYARAEGADTWTRFTTRTRAVVAHYDRGRAAVAGLAGWRLADSWRCELGWVDTRDVLDR